MPFGWPAASPQTAVMNPHTRARACCPCVESPGMPPPPMKWSTGYIPERTTKPPLSGPFGRNKVPKVLIERKSLMNDATRYGQETQGDPPGMAAQILCSKQVISTCCTSIPSRPHSLVRQEGLHQKGMKEPNYNRQKLRAA